MKRVGRFRLSEANTARQPLWTTSELARKVGTNTQRLFILLNKHPAPAVLAKAPDGAKKYGLYDFMKWWKTIPESDRVYATSTDSITATKSTRSYPRYGRLKVSDTD